MSGTPVPFSPRNLPRTTVTALLLLFVILFPLTRPEDPDVWFHLSAGRHVWATGEYPGMDRFLYTYPAGSPSSHHEWLFQATLYPFYRAFSMPGLVVFKSLLVATSFLWLFFGSVTRGSFYPSLFFFLVAFGAGSGRFFIRPEIAGALVLAGMWKLLSGPLGLRRAAAVLLLQILWTNLHWSSILGVAVVMAFAAADVAGRRLPLPLEWTAGTEGSRWFAYPLLLPCTVAVTLLNPDGWRPLVEPFRYFFGGGFLLPVVEVWPTSRALFREGLSSFQAWFFLAFLLGLLSFSLNARRIRLSHLFSFAGLALLAFSAERHILFFALLAVPIVTGNISALLETRRMVPSHTRELLSSFLATIVLVTLIMNKVTGISFFLPYPRPYEPLSLGESEVLWPRKAADFLLESDLPDPIFNNFNSGNFLNWAVYPRRVFINGTFSHRPTEEAYARLRSHPGEWGDFARREGIMTVFLRLSPLIAPSRLVASIVQDPDWKIVYYDGGAVILVQAGTAAAKRYAVDLGREFQSAMHRFLKGDGRGGTAIPIWREVVQYRWHMDMTRIFRLRGQFYLLSRRPDLAAGAADMVRYLEGGS